MAVYNVENYIGEAIDSVINQTFDFNKVQLILVDDGSTDNSKEIALNYQSKYPDNILVLSKENGGQASARNYGLQYVEGQYVNFLDSDDKLSKNTLKAVYDFFNNYKDINLVSIPIFFFERKEGNHPLNYKFAPKNKIIDLTKDIFDIQLSGPSSFIKKESIKNHDFNEDLIHGEDALIVNKILLDNMKYGVIGLNKKACYLYRKRFTNDSTLDTASHDDRYFTHKLKNYYKYLLDYSFEKFNHVPKFIQAMVAYDLQTLYKLSDLPEEWDEYKINEFWDYFYQVLNFIDDEIIINHSSISKISKSFLIYLKRKDFHIVTNSRKNKVFLKSGDYNINKIHNHKLRFDFVELKNGFLNFSCNFVSSCDNRFIKLVAELKSNNGEVEIFEGNKVEYFNRGRISPIKYLTFDWHFVSNFDLKIPLNNNELSSIRFKIIYQENDDEVVMQPDIEFRPHSNMNNLINYFVKDSKIVIFDNNMFYFLPYSYLKLFKLSFKSISNILSDGNYLSMVFYVLIYLFLYPFMHNKNIWLFEDRPSIADDNAKHLFSYAIKQNDSCKKYFVVDKKSVDYDKMLRIDKNIVNFMSFKHKILYLFADKIISSHINDVFLDPFYSEKSYLKGLITYDKYFLQHGVTKDDLSKWLRKYYHNFALFVTCSELERDSIINGKYTYDDEIIQILGLPRYDNLKNNNIKKEILFVPTWRSYIEDEDTFINSEYCKKLNNFFENNNLMKIIKDKGYKLVFKPHYNLLPYLHLLNIDDSVQIAEKESYQDLFNESSLMITDYSSVFFDFAYLKKPIIYYQFEDNHYDKGYFDYETIGFGSITKDEDNLVNKIIEYLDNECKMEDEYKKRVDKFFKYNDQNNCKRVYEWILTH